ncbi:MAG: hypothetical protein ACPG4Q_13740 [Phycisphaeraceae bacterium]
MRLSSYTRIVSSSCLLSMLAVLGCESATKVDNQPLYAPPRQPEPRQARDDAPTAAQMQEILSRLQVLELEKHELKNELKKERSDRYMEEIKLRKAQLEAEKVKQRPVPAPAANQFVPRAQANQGQKPDTQPRVAPIDPSQLSREQLLDALIKKIASGKHSGRVKALMAAGLSVASDHKQMDPLLLDALDPKSREQVARYHQMLAVIFDELAGDHDAKLTRQEMIRKIDEVFGAQPLTIETLKLCREVSGYGVFEPFATTRFLAGRENPVVVYAEIENFKHVPREDGEYEVRLEQTIELFDAAGQAVVWRSGPESMVDVSRNKRRDFFVVKRVDLPQRLPAGGYRLKVRIADKHSGSICEQTMHDIQIVADQGLLGVR